MASAELWTFMLLCWRGRQPSAAADIATGLVTLHGMAETLAQLTYLDPPQGFLSGQAHDEAVTSDATLREIDPCVRDIAAVAVDESRAILTMRRSDPGQDAEILRKKEAITAEVCRLSSRSRWVTALAVPAVSA